MSLYMAEAFMGYHASIGKYVRLRLRKLLSTCLARYLLWVKQSLSGSVVIL